MADLRLIEYRRKWKKQVATFPVIILAGHETTTAVGMGTLGVKALIVKASLILNEDVAAAATNSVSYLKFQLFDRRANGTGVISGCTAGNVTIGLKTLTSVTGATFVTWQVMAGDIVQISSAAAATNDGYYVVASVESETALTVQSPFIATATDVVIARTGQIGSDVDNTAALADDIIHDFAAGGYILDEGDVIGIESVGADFATSTPPGIPGGVVVIEYIPLFAL